MPKKICSVDDCGRAAVARGLCFPHYQRQRRNGAVGTEPVRTRGVGLKWLEAHKSWPDHDSCLTWPFGRKSSGYGPSREMAEMAHGAPPTRLHVAAHTCGKGHQGCVNPNHLYWATPAQNAADRELHGTMLRGDAAPWSKLTSDEVKSIRSALQLRKWGQNRELAQKYGVHEATICDIKNGRKWRHVN